MKDVAYSVSRASDDVSSTTVATSSNVLLGEDLVNKTRNPTVNQNQEQNQMLCFHFKTIVVKIASEEDVKKWVHAEDTFRDWRRRNHPAC